MMPNKRLLAIAGLAASVSCSSPSSSNCTSPNPVVPSVWDGQCFYPLGALDFDLATFVGGKWFDQASTVTQYNGGCKCTYAEYTLNAADGTVGVHNSCEEISNGASFDVQGTATPAGLQYGANGVFVVSFPGYPPPVCPGPNFIVQDYAGDIAIVQSTNFTELYIISRQQHLEESVLDLWLQRAADLGGNVDNVAKIDQSNCKYV